MSLAERLLDAQVAHHLARLSGDRAAETVARLAEAVLATSGRHPLGELVDVDAITAIVSRSLVTVPGSAAVAGIVELVTQVVRDGPPAAYPLADVVDRDRVEALLDELLALSPVLERGLDRLTASPLVGTTASRFMGRVVAEVVQANQAVADRVPGLGSLVSLGTSAAARMMGAADKQLEGLLGETVGRGGTFAVRRLNKIVIETLRDPTTREAALQVWDLLAAAPLPRPGVERVDVSGVVGAGHDLVVGTLATEQVGQLGERIVVAFFDRFGGYTPAELLDELDLDRADLVADLVRIAPRILDALRESGDLEQLIRAELAPFYASPEVTALLEG